MEPNPQDIGALNRQPEDMNFLQGMQFKFVIRKLPNTNIFVQRCNLPSLSLAAAEQKTPLQDLPLPGTTLSYGDLLVTFRVNADFSNYLELFTWINGEGFPKDTEQYANLKNENNDLNAEFGGIFSDAILHVMDNNGNPIINILYRDTFITHLSDVYFDTATIDPNFLVCEATFKYAYLDIEKVI